jgi:TolB-like protein
MKGKALVCLVLVWGYAAAWGQQKESLALLPFTGGQGKDGEYIVAELARQRVLREGFKKVTLVTSTTRAFMKFEQRFQRESGMTDADTIFEAGKQLDAAYVIAGYITKLGDRNLVVVNILDVESLQQIAGDYRPYKNIEEVDSMIPDIARKLAESVQRDTSKLPGLSVPPFEVSEEVNAEDAQALAQILAVNLANGNAYAVLPRTDSLQKVLEEHRRQRTGETDQERVKRLGAGRNAEYVLAGSISKLGKLNRFTADVLHIEDGSFVDGYSERYTLFTEGMEAIPKLAASLNGGAVEQGVLVVEAATGGMVSITGNGVNQSVTVSAGGRYRQSYAAGTYTVKIRYGDGKEESRTVTVPGDGEVTAGFMYRPVVQGT